MAAVVDLDVRGADREGVVRGEAEHGQVLALSSCAVERVPVRHHPQTVEALKRGHGGPPGRKTGSA